MDYYDEAIAREAVDFADTIIAFAEEQIGRL
jgi:hypothetical protein